MSETEQARPTGSVFAQTLEQRVADLERERSRQRAFSGYARCYAALAGIMIALSFLPIVGDDVVIGESGTEFTYRFGSLWKMAENGDPAVAGVLLLIALATMFLVATFRPAGPGLPAAMAAVAVVMVVILIARPGTGQADPPLAEAGQAAVAVLLLTAVLGVIHEIHLRVDRTSTNRATT